MSTTDATPPVVEEAGQTATTVVPPTVAVAVKDAMGGTQPSRAVDPLTQLLSSGAMAGLLQNMDPEALLASFGGKKTDKREGGEGETEEGQTDRFYEEGGR